LEDNKKLKEMLKAVQSDFNLMKKRDEAEIKLLKKTVERNEQQYGKQIKKLEEETVNRL